MQAAEQRAGIGAPSGKRFSVKVSGLVDAFILATGAELVETDIASCWNLREGATPAQKRDASFGNVIMFLDEFTQRQPSGCEWDELVYPPPLAPCKVPRHG